MLLLLVDRANASQDLVHRPQTAIGTMATQTAPDTQQVEHSLMLLSSSVHMLVPQAASGLAALRKIVFVLGGPGSGKGTQVGGGVSR